MWIVPGFQYKKALCSHHEYPICNCAHSYSLSPCQPLLWNLSIPGSTKQWIAKELHLKSRCAHRDPLPTLVPKYKVSLPTFGREKRACSHQFPASTVLGHRAWAARVSSKTNSSKIHSDLVTRVDKICGLRLFFLAERVNPVTSRLLLKNQDLQKAIGSGKHEHSLVLHY